MQMRITLTAAKDKLKQQGDLFLMNEEKLEVCALEWREILDIFKKFAEKHSIKTKWHSFLQIPNDHRFGTYHTPETVFGGPDLITGEKLVYGDVFLFYKGDKTDDDLFIEEELEYRLRHAAKFRKICGFDDENMLFYTRYAFLCHEGVKMN